MVWLLLEGLIGRWKGKLHHTSYLTFLNIFFKKFLHRLSLPLTHSFSKSPLCRFLYFYPRDTMLHNSRGHPSYVPCSLWGSRWQPCHTLFNNPTQHTVPRRPKLCPDTFLAPNPGPPSSHLSHFMKVTTHHRDCPPAEHSPPQRNGKLWGRAYLHIACGWTKVLRGEFNCHIHAAARRQPLSCKPTLCTIVQYWPFYSIWVGERKDCVLCMYIPLRCITMLCTY